MSTRIKIVSGDSINPAFRTALDGNGLTFDGVNDYCLINSQLITNTNVPFTMLMAYKAPLFFYYEEGNIAGGGIVGWAGLNFNGAFIQIGRYIAGLEKRLGVNHSSTNNSVKKSASGANVSIITKSSGNTSADAKMWQNGFGMALTALFDTMEAGVSLIGTGINANKTIIGRHYNSASGSVYKAGVCRLMQVLNREITDEEAALASNYGTLRVVEPLTSEYLLDLDFNQTGNPAVNPPLDLGNSGFTVTPSGFPTSGAYVTFQ